MEITKQMDNESYKTKLYVLKEKDPYNIIGVKDDASLDEITKIYRGLAKELHPDRQINRTIEERDTINQIFTKITSAFNLLKDPESRKKYDYEKKSRLEREQMLNSLKNNATNISDESAKSPSLNLRQTQVGLNLRDTQPGAININGMFTDSKIDAKELKAKQAEALYNTALTKINKGDLEAAISDLQSAIELNGKIAKFHSKLGLAMKNKGWNGYAMAEFKIALSLDPKDKIALENYSPTNNNKNLSDSRKEKPEDGGILNKVKNLFKKS